MKGISAVVWNARGRVPVIVQDAGTGAVLALDTMDRAALVATLSTGQATYWVPDDDSLRGCAANGPQQMVTAVHLACDGRSLLLKVQPSGPLCQTGAITCFETVLSADAGDSRSAGFPGGDDVIIQWSPEAAEGA